MKKLSPILIILSILFSLVTPAPAIAQGQDSCDTAIVHYKRNGIDYEGWGLHIWGPTAVEVVTWTEPYQPTGEDDYGILWEVPLADGADHLNYIVHKDDEKDPGPDQTMTFADVGCEIWLTRGKADQFTDPEAAIASMDAAAPEPVLISAPEGDENQAVIHYSRALGDYDDWGLHIWGPTAVEGVTWAAPHQPAGQDEYGIFWVVDMQADADHLNYIVHKGDIKDPGPDQKLQFNVRGYEIWLIEGIAEQFTSMEAAIEAFKAASLGNIQDSAKAFWLSKNYLAWDADLSVDNQHFINYSPDGTLELTESGIQGGESVPLLFVGNIMRPEIAEKFPHLEGMSILKLTDEYVDMIPEILHGQVVISALSVDGLPKGATAIQIPGVLDDVYAGSAWDEILGVEFEGGVPTLRVWAPTAITVSLLLYSDSTTSKAEEIPMEFNPATGIWSVTGEANWKGKFYLYDVEVFVRQEGKLVHNLVTDPYSFSLAMNSTRSQIVDLNDPALMPDGWDALEKPELTAFTDIVLYELHVRDFSVIDETIPEEQRGTFIAFTNPESNGMQHLNRIADAGVTHVHLLPVFDIATINEDKSQWQNVDFTALAGLPSDSEEQQAIINSIRGQDGFNWGYDPYHYTVPEGSYSTSPDGATRILEFRQMVMGLSDAGLRVVMDVVYNHTNASGQSEKSVLDKVVPGYYHRLNTRGAVETSTCCQNTATEHAMMRKLMIDSVLTWVTAYKVDGFRFDLMGHHMVEDMVALREALNELSAKADGVNGEMVYVYGEGWNFGEVADNARGINATQTNMTGNRVGSFNDRLRDAARGGSPFTDQREQGYTTGLYTDPNEYTTLGAEAQLAKLLEQKDLLRVTLAGNLVDYELINAAGDTVTGIEVLYNNTQAAYAANPEENIVYVSAHDNETLFDAVQYKLPLDATLEERVQAQSLALSLASFSQGVPFYHAGSEILRSKSMDRDSYDSTDWFNALDWTYTDNGWGHGLPIQDKNGNSWPVIGTYLGNPDIAPGQAEILAAQKLFEQWVSIRKSSPLFRLQTSEQIKEQVQFHNTGPDQVPGLIVMSISDNAEKRLDMNYDLIVVLWNADPDEVNFTLENLDAGELDLHPLILDAHNSRASYDVGSQTFTLPGRSAVVFARENLAPLVEEPTKEAAQPELAAETVGAEPIAIWLLIIGAAVLVSLTGYGILLQFRKKRK